jgi:hypothetical protein
MKQNLLKFNTRGNTLRNLFSRNVTLNKLKSGKKDPLRRRFLMLSSLIAVLTLVLAPIAFTDNVITELVPGTAVLLSQSGGGSGNGGNTSSTTSRTNIFAPSAYVDYKRLGGEPTVVIDRYPFTPGQFGNMGTTNQYRDLGYYSAPLGLGTYSFFWKSDDLGQTWRLPLHQPIDGRIPTQGVGGGDSHQAVGEVTHKIFFLDLPAGCVTMNTSSDLGETWVADELGCGSSPGVIDDRQWVATDEGYTGIGGPSQNVYTSFIEVFDLEGNVPPWPTLGLARSQQDGDPGTFATDSSCNVANAVVENPGGSLGNEPVGDNVPTHCPDPNDYRLWLAGPVVADKEFYSGRPVPTHRVYIPFERAASFSGGSPWELYVAISDNGGETWYRRHIATRVNNAANIFPQLTIDRGGNLYYTWSEEKSPAGEQEVYYAFSTTGGETWSPPIPLTQETGNSAVFPWMVAGDPGQVDIVYYQSNSGLNSNVSFVDANGNACPDPQSETGCTGARPNPAVWNVYFGQSQNALNTGSNFKNVQISDHPIHIGSVSTGGLGGNADRSLLDFLTVDVDHLGAANVAWADNNNSRLDTRNKFARQISGNSVYKNQTIGLQQTWPIRDHAVGDLSGDVFNALGLPTPCPAMDVLSTATQRSGDLLTVTMSLGAPPTALQAIACGGGGTTGGLWGAEFWASSLATSAFGGGPNANFYVAYRDNPGDPTAPTPGVEAGRLDAYTVVTNEFHREVLGVPVTPGGTCFSALPPVPCTVTMTVSLSSLGIKSGTGLYSITGGSFYFFGGEDPVPETRVPMGFSNQADVTAALDDNGTGTTK